MEFRRSPRVRPGRIVRLTFLEKSLVEGGTLLDISETGMGILVDSPIDSGTTLHVELEGHLLVGTSVHCVPTSQQSFRVGLELVNRLSGTDWDRLIHKWRKDDAPSPASGDLQTPSGAPQPVADAF